MVYREGNARESFDLDHGLAGLVAKQTKGFIVNDVKCSTFFNKLVDI